MRFAMMDMSPPSPYLVLGARQEDQQDDQQEDQQEGSCFSGKLKDFGGPSWGLPEGKQVNAKPKPRRYISLSALDRVLAKSSGGNFLLCEIKTRLASRLLVHPSLPSGLSVVPPGACWALG